MIKKAAFFIFLSGLAGFCHAAYIEWDGGAGDSNWANPVNWAKTGPSERVPNATADKAGFKSGTSASYPRFNMVCPTVYQLTIGGTNGFMTLDGGSITINQYLQVSATSTEVGTLVVNGGTLTTNASGSAQGPLLIGMAGTGTLNMNGGTIYVSINTAANRFSIADTAGSTGTVNLDGGTIWARDFYINKNGGATGLLNITNGILIINTDNGDEARVQSYIANNLIKGFGSSANVHYDTTTNPGYVTVWATAASASFMYWSGNFSPIALANIASRTDAPNGSSQITLSTNGDAEISADNTNTARLTESGGDHLYTEYKLEFDGDGVSTTGGSTVDFTSYDSFLSSPAAVTYIPDDNDVQVTLYVRASNYTGQLADAGNYSAAQTLTVSWVGP